MKKTILILMVLLSVTCAHSSKLSKFLNKLEEDDRRQNAQELQQDMNFSDFAFRLQRRFIDTRGQNCRDYEVRGRSNPYKNGFYTICG